MASSRLSRPTHLRFRAISPWMYGIFQQNSTCSCWLFLIYVRILIALMEIICVSCLRASRVTNYPCERERERERVEFSAKIQKRDLYSMEK